MSAPSRTSGKPGYRQMNARLPEQLVHEINAYAQVHGMFRDATLEHMLRDALAQAGTRTRENARTVSVEFSFPDEIKAVCEQYLLYFGEFLRDVGVQVTAELSEKADTLGTVLFNVTPTDPKVALSKIREALNIYLALPQNTITPPDESASLAEKKLQANIDHLRHQLELLTVIAGSQRLQLQNQQTTIVTQQHLIAKLESTPSSADREEFLGGSFALTKLERGGFEFNLAQIFRHVRDLFKRRKAFRPPNSR